MKQTGERGAHAPRSPVYVLSLCHPAVAVLFLSLIHIFVAGMLGYIKLVAEKRPYPSKLQDTLASVHHCDLVLGHQLLS